ncbi:type VI secretion system lipoprotein TssJ [Cloacibacillus porcorum]|uniref:type VI secretion system lipoprotein TssJ n=1 Tax=Cloacibacillus porcorum TaxID=1197717 RepID=UPI0026712000|nr:type VI secretion system lipoprotein TssJ [Cloacibacillus porcorum]
MSRRLAGLFLAFFIILAGLMISPSGCEAAKRKPAPPPDGALKPSEVVWSQEKNGLSVSIEASEDLNYAYGSPLGLTLCLYQLSDLAKFTALASTFAGIDKLLGGEIDQLGGAALMSQVVRLQPGEKISRSFDRMEGAKYFAVAAGYAHGDPSGCSAYVQFPVNSTVIKLKHHKTATYYTAGTIAAIVSCNAKAVTVTGGEGEYEQ